MSKRRSTHLRLFTWPQKRNENQSEEERRPVTATLEKPRILDIRFLGKIDMSLVRKEFLNITNLCRSPFNIVKIPTSQTRLPRLLGSDNNLKVKRREKHPETSDESSSASPTEKARSIKPLNVIKIAPRNSKPLKMQKTDEDLNNNDDKFTEAVRKLALKNSTSLEGKSTKLSEPCKTCGRPDQPERFHSHPVTPLKPRGAKKKVKTPVKNTVQKPLAIKYKSRQSDIKSTDLMSPIPTQNLVHSPLVTNNGNSGQVQSVRPRTGKGPRTLMCYICGREFGTASLPLHEPKCIEKFERENATFPKNQRRKLPPRPDTPLKPELWNQRAWEVCQASLVPCENCKRTFLPDRLEVHQRSCKPQQMSKDFQKADIETTAAGSAALRGVQCSICGRMFGKKSIKIHQPQCLKKWKQENDLLPPDKRQPFPPRLVSAKNPTEEPQVTEKEKKSSSAESNKPPLFPCYLCGRLFGVSSIYIHEPQCLKKFQAENEKLPPNKRRPIPAKPDIKFTPSGGVDFVGTFHRIWDNHLAELVECRKCGRTFFPDRIEKHEMVCNGMRVNINKKK